MSILIKELAEYLENINVGTVGQTIFIGEFPKEIEDVIIIVSVPSAEPDKYTGIEYQTIDVWARYGNSEAGYEKLEQVFNLLNRTGKHILPNYEIYNIRALGRIEDFDRDIEGRKLLKLTLQIIYRNLDLVS